MPVATVLTVYGIETNLNALLGLLIIVTLQQSLPFTVLKQTIKALKFSGFAMVATVLTVYGIETTYEYILYLYALLGCNSPYRLRY